MTEKLEPEDMMAEDTFEAAIRRMKLKGAEPHIIYPDPTEDLFPKPSLRQVASKKKTILEEAAEATSGDRQRDYGHPRDNFQLISDLWVIISRFAKTRGEDPDSPKMVALKMIVMKVARELNSSKRDNLTDIAGYARTMEMLLE